jgi:DnaK suppressor protein
MFSMTLDLQQIKRRLEEKQAELQATINDQDQAYPTPVDPTEASEGPQDFEEAAVDVEETDKERVVLVSEQVLLTEVQDALKRIENGTYGRCVDCGRPIPEKRLEAIPWAARCAQDEEKWEKERLSREEI